MSYEDANSLEKAIEGMIKAHDYDKEEAAYAGDRQSYERHDDVVCALEQVLTMVQAVSGLYA